MPLLCLTFFFSSDKFLSISNLFCFSWRVLVCFFWPTTTPNCRQMLIDVPCRKRRMWQHVEAATIAGIPPWLPWFPIIIEPSLTGGFGWKGLLLLSLLWWRLCCSRWHIKGTNPSLQNSLAHKTKLSRELSTLFQFSQNANFIKFQTEVVYRLGTSFDCNQKHVGLFLSSHVLLG